MDTEFLSEVMEELWAWMAGIVAQHCAFTSCHGTALSDG